jgi:hypothetical protein
MDSGFRRNDGGGQSRICFERAQSTLFEAVLHSKSAAMDGRFWTPLFGMLEKQVNEG